MRGSRCSQHIPGREDGSHAQRGHPAGLGGLDPRDGVLDDEAALRRDAELEDPAGRGLDEIRPIRDEIERRVRSLVADLGVSPDEEPADPGR